MGYCARQNSPVFLAAAEKPADLHKRINSIALLCSSPLSLANPRSQLVQRLNFCSLQKSIHPWQETRDCQSLIWRKITRKRSSRENSHSVVSVCQSGNIIHLDREISLDTRNEHVWNCRSVSFTSKLRDQRHNRSFPLLVYILLLTRLIMVKVLRLCGSDPWKCSALGKQKEIRS